MITKNPVRSARSKADLLLEGDRSTAAALGRKLLKPAADNLVERPWGGTRLPEFKRLDGAAQGQNRPIGESFELAADDDDAEARDHPSVLPLDDGSEIALPRLLSIHAEGLLGEPFVRRHGHKLPLLPKLLDVHELLSMQAHPAGNTEVYVIVAAAPGATLRLGFSADVDAASFAAELTAGRKEQARLLELAAKRVSPEALQNELKPWLARRAAAPDELAATLEAHGVSAQREELRRCIAALHRAYWSALDRLNAIPVTPGQVIYNSNPPRVVAARGVPASAEVHALGNPEGLPVLALEIRKPGPTFRAWDNVRFPIRNIDIDAALAALNLGATSPEEFIVEPKATRDGVLRSVDCEYFRLEHLRPTKERAVIVPASGPHTLHALEGASTVYATDGQNLGTLARGESALVPIGVGAYRVAVDVEPVEIVKVDLPPYAD